MSMLGDLVLRLLADSAVSAIVGTKVYLSAAPQETAVPYVTVQIVSGPNYGHDLEVGGFGHADARVQIDAWCVNEAQRASLCEAIRQSLQGYIGELVAGGTYSGGIGFQGPSDSYVDPSRGESIGIFGGRCEIFIGYAVPELS